MKNILPKSSKLDFSTRFKRSPKSMNKRTVGDFWQWALSDLLQNTTRGILAEYIVAVLLGVDDKPRSPWKAYDLILPDGRTVEVKTMSRLQAWVQKRLSTPRVVIQPTRKWDPETGIMGKKPSFNASLYVLCYFNADNYNVADPLDLAQWEFFIFSKENIKKLLKERKSVSLKYLRTLGIKSVKAHELRAKVMQCK